MSNKNEPLICLEGIKKVFLTDEIETHALDPRFASKAELQIHLFDGRFMEEAETQKWTASLNA